jgi:16S rRNA C967 or C1407 C5-methylase (RsmB/RsmF family)
MAKKGKTKRAEQFYKRMETLVGGAEARQLMKAIQQRGPKSVRYNRKQCALDELTGTPVPWCLPYGRCWEEEISPSRTVEYVAGKYYIQESSAMLAISTASQVIDFSDKIVLDIAAAPGGKATQVAELFDSGYLVANEVIKKRVDALIWNVNRLRFNNVIITSLTTGAMAQFLPGFFDVVVVDAPCSGEGLFMKQKHSLEKWSEKNVRFCARRQQAILKDAAVLVRPGGYIVYSTCTFAPEENENQVAFLLTRNFNPVPLPERLPVSPAISTNPGVCLCSRRIFPHREGGAGAFVCVVQKDDTPAPSVQWKYFPGQSHPLGLRKEPFPYIHMQGAAGYFYEKNNIICYFSHERIPEFLRQNSCQIGAPVIHKYRPHECLFGSIQLPSKDVIIEVGEEEAEAYIRGEELRLPRADADGYYIIAFQGMLLGHVKIIGSRVVNKLPKALRIKDSTSTLT